MDNLWGPENECGNDSINSFETNKNLSKSNVRLTYKVGITYYGPHFHGWSHQDDIDSLEKALKDKISDLLPDANIVVSPAGRTDRGVSACAQVISFYGWRMLSPSFILEALNSVAPGKLRAVWAQEVPRKFHATFCARWRRYVYLFPLRRGGNNVDESSPNFIEEGDVAASRVNLLLEQLEGQQLDYYSYARDTPQGKECTCTLYYSRSTIITLHSDLLGHQDDAESLDLLCIELIGNRFLRKMVRVLVSTAIREASIGSATKGEIDALIQLAERKDRLSTAPAAPSEGLCFSGVGYSPYVL